MVKIFSCSLLTTLGELMFDDSLNRRGESG